MTKTVTLTLKTVDRDLPAGREFAGFRFRLSSPGGASAEDITTETTTVFAGVPPSAYTASVQAIDSAGQALDEGVNIEVVVSAARVYRSPAGLVAEVA